MQVKYTLNDVLNAIFSLLLWLMACFNTKPLFLWLGMWTQPADVIQLAKQMLYRYACCRRGSNVNDEYQRTFLVTENRWLVAIEILLRHGIYWVMRFYQKQMTIESSKKVKKKTWIGHSLTLSKHWYKRYLGVGGITPLAELPHKS